MNAPKTIRHRIIAVIVAGLAAFLGISVLAGRRLVAPANGPVGPPPDEYAVETVSIPSDSGSRLSGWYIPCDGAAATVILLHPVRTDRRAMFGRAQLLHAAGYATLLIDLRAHGESPGKNITAGYRERFDVAAAVDFVRARTPDHRVGVVGWSLGGAAALYASPLGIDALVLESVYPTIREAVHNRIAMRLGPLSHLLTPILLVQMKIGLGLSASQLRPVDSIGRAGCPVLVTSGDSDLRTTVAETERLFLAANEPRLLLVFRGAAHTDLLSHDPRIYQKIVTFLDTYLKDEG